MALDLPNYLFKLRYGELDDGALMHGNPLMSWAGHDKNFTSHKGIEIPSPTNTPQGIGPTNATAFAADSPSTGQSFTVPQRSVYHYASITGKTVRNAMEGGDVSQFRNSFTREVDLALEALGAEINQRMYGVNRGDRSLIKAGSTVSGTTITLNKKTDAQFYEVGMRLHALNPSTGALRTGGTGYAVVSAVNPQAGTLTWTEAGTTAISSLVAGDILIRANMRNLDMDGLAGWAPVTPSASFLGVDQTLYPGRACGLYLDLSSANTAAGLLYAIRYAGSYVGRRFDNKSPWFINPMNLHAIEREVEQSRILSQTMQGTYGVGIEVVEIMGKRFVPDALCPRDTTFLVGSGAFTRGSCGNQPRLEDLDGRRFYYNRQTGSLEFTLVHDGNCYSESPYNLMQCTLQAAPEL
jgi:hypothetical protein